MSTTYNAPPHDYLLDCYRWLANADYPGGGIYPNYLRETFDDRAHVVWVAGRYAELWQTTGPHDQPAIKHANIKHAIFGEIQRIKERGGNAPAPAPRPVPSLSPLEPLTVDVRKRWFRTSAGLFDYREVSAFSLLALWLTRQDEAIQCIDEMRAERFTVLRVMITLDGPYWVDEARRLTGRSLRCAPDMPGYYDGLLELVRHCAVKGLSVRVVLIGATEPFGGVWYPDRRDVWTGTEVGRRADRLAMMIRKGVDPGPVR